MAVGGGTSEAFVSLRADTNALRQDIGRATAITGGGIAKLTALIVSFGVSYKGVEAVMKEGFARTDRRPFSAMKNELVRTKDLLFDMNMPANKLFGVMTRGAGGLTHRLRSMNDQMNRFVDALIRANVGGVRRRVTPQTGTVQTAGGPYTFYNPNVRLRGGGLYTPGAADAMLGMIAGIGIQTKRKSDQVLQFMEYVTRQAGIGLTAGRAP